ncbi:transporter substrate-binding domain-containing protein [Oceanobacillus neutriphilus]|uniref:ABC transporter extracellular-binding protein YckB n=1 Tax=Oceanobacillus neutriphilus TaxID=531815 RepID=A0ABQ2P2Z6_9BACI|nr:transporter substrate-binding domain-containing protein [Oceanobacillus neutriphilus]GGP17048.1 putative ABC transporter extracellular-binding protein YckB [Oceanobacillus neutriphilus]
MRKNLFIFSFMLVAVFLLTACGEGENDNKDNAEAEDKHWKEIQGKGEIVAGTSGTLIGASYYDENDELTGYTVEIMREVGKRLDLEVKFEIMGADDLATAINSGRIDVGANDATITEKNQEKFRFSEPYKYSYIVAAVRESDNSGIETLDDLEGKKAGGAATTIYSQIAEHFGAEVVTYGNAPNEAYLSDISTGRTDLVLNDYYLTKFGVAAFPDFDLHLHPTLKFNPTKQAIMMPKDASKLQEEINGALNSMREDGTLSELAKEFYEEDASKEPDVEVEIVEGLDF